MSTGLWIVVGTLVMFVIAAWVGPDEQKKQASQPDPY